MHHRSFLRSLPWRYVGVDDAFVRCDEVWVWIVDDDDDASRKVMFVMMMLSRGRQA